MDGHAAEMAAAASRVDRTDPRSPATNSADSSRAARSPASRSRATNVTRTPRSTSSLATANPIPRFPPVTTAFIFLEYYSRIIFQHDRQPAPTLTHRQPLRRRWAWRAALTVSRSDAAGLGGRVG